MILYFVRHGETDFNVTHRLQGKAIDEPMNANGVRQIEELIPTLPDDFEAIYTSPLKRVLMSAEMIRTRFPKPLIIREELNERDFGSLAGKTWDELPDGQELRRIDREQRYDYHPYGGESVEDVTERVRRFLAETKRSPYSKILVVSSVGILRVLYKILLNEEIHEIANASVHRFEI